MAESQPTTNNTLSSGQDVLKRFQLESLSIEEKSSKEFGLEISKKIWGYITSGLGGYYYNRNARFFKNRNFANGRIDVQAMFQDRFQFNGKQNYIRLVWQTLQIVNRIVSGLVGRWMERGEKIVVQAIDDLSQHDKEEEYAQIDFIIENRQKLEELQQSSGVQMIPQDKDLPADKEELNLWKQQFQRIPEEIETELACNEILGSNGWYDVLKEKMLHDSAEVGFVGTYTWMDEQGVVHCDWVKPENAIYSASDYEDFRDTSWRGQMPDIKISDVRRMYGKEFHPDDPLALDEQQLFKVAQGSKEYKNYSNLTWDSNFAAWTVPFSLRPYDEWNVRQMMFELRTVDTEPYTVTKTPFNRTYTRKGAPKEKDNNWSTTEMIGDTNYNIYEGVYLPDSDMLIKWGLKDNMICPQDPREVGNAEFSYSFYMYQNYQMRNLAIPEKIEAAIDNMILSCLKMQQVIARMRPTGAAINEDALQEIDFGLGEAGNKAVDKKVLFDQTGDIYYRGRDAEGNPIPVPITELANSGFLGQMDGLIRNYQFWYQTLKDELGEDPNLISAALQPRVTASNVEASQDTSATATNYIYTAYIECMKMTSRKITCLIKDSIHYGSDAYRKLVKQDIDKRIFATDIRFLPTDVEVQRFEALMTQAIQANQELLLFLDPFRLVRIAKEDAKLAELLFRQAQKKLVAYQIQTAKANQDATFNAQQQSAIVGEQEKGKNMQMELQMKGEQSAWADKSKKEQIVLTGIFELAKVLATPKPVGANGQAAEAGQLPPSLMELMELSIRNIAIPLAVDNQTMVQGVGQGAAQQQQQPQPQPQDQQQQMQQNQSQPQPQVAA